ncbi:hypothetical protein CR152_29965 [Massilia violaceinigra]|uniref:Uncharacterized protein n=1 Tax=Massilia violaceinigra TaxID=2045208 RepID=A0A2D2DTG0_9BURK|nr:hypothetical protein [Massilia violaceinigra]ATQ78264.1 hypothetical protein CR152_29965 [Massilia violaceinigra]
MRLNIVSDANWESRVDLVLNWLSSTSYRQFFSDQDYGDGLCGVSVVLICRDPILKFKRRIRLSKKEKKLYMDIMLPLEGFVNAEAVSRKTMVIDSLLVEVPKIVGEYSIPAFSAERFLVDFAEVFSNLKQQISIEEIERQGQRY